MSIEGQIIESCPIVQCITNTVTINDCANAILAVGASATMAHHIEEVAEIQSGCNALVLNLGATECFDAMKKAFTAANKKETPIIIDPVGCGGSSFRRKFFVELSSLGKLACIRGNYSEILALYKEMATSIGVDSKEDMSSCPEVIENAVAGLAKKHNCFVVASGEVDVISDGDTIKRISGGSNLMKKITGAGCMSSAILGAYLATKNSFDSVEACCRRMKNAGEVAEKQTREKNAGTMTFRNLLIDELSR